MHVHIYVLGFFSFSHESTQIKAWTTLPSEWVTIQHVQVEDCLAIPEVYRYVRYENTVQKAAGHHTARSTSKDK